MNGIRKTKQLSKFKFLKLRHRNFTGSVLHEEISISINKNDYLFVGWAICVSVIPIPNTASAVIWRFWAELIPLVSIIALTLIFWLIDKRKTCLHLTGKLVNNIILG